MNQRNILIVAATAGELAPLAETAGVTDIPSGKVKSVFINKVPADILITGPGMVATAYALGRMRGLHEYSLVINAGIAGSFNTSRNIAEVLLITADCFIEMGCEKPEPFRSMYSMPMAQTYRPSWMSSDNVIYNDQPPALESLSVLPCVNGITVNFMSGEYPPESHLPQNYSAETESMEGAAFFYACKMAGIPCVQIRSISNYIGSDPRWNIPAAVKSLNETVLTIIHELS
jgi:futalosine hydrolase